MFQNMQSRLLDLLLWKISLFRQNVITPPVLVKFERLIWTTTSFGVELSVPKYAKPESITALDKKIVRN